MHNTKLEMQGKCRRLFYAKKDFPVIEGQSITKAGDVMGIVGGDSVALDLTDDELIIYTFRDYSAPEYIGCIEDFFNTIPKTKPLKVDMTKIQKILDCVKAHKAAVKAEKDFIFINGLKLFGTEFSTNVGFVHALKIRELISENQDPEEYSLILDTQKQMDVLSQSCYDLCDQLLTDRDEVITFKEGIGGRSLTV